MPSFEFTPTKQDYLKAFRSFYLTRWKEQALLLSIAFIMIACSLLAALQGNLGEFRYFIFALFGLLFFFLLYAVVISPLIVANKVPKDERLNSPVLYELRDEHIEIKNKFSEHKMDWGSFQKIIETEEYLLLIYTVNKNAFQIIPKRAFVTSDDEKKFIKVAQERINNASKSAPKPKKKSITARQMLLIILISILVACGAMVYMSILQNT